MIRFLLMLYPKAWRREYGDELGDILSTDGLTVGMVADVLRGAAYQRARRVPAWVVAGLALLCLSFVQMLLSGNITVNGRALSPSWWHGSYMVFDDLTLDDSAELGLDFLLLVTGGWLAARKGGSFLSGLLGAAGAYLIRSLPGLVLVLLPGGRASNDDGPLVFATKFGMLAWFFGHMLVRAASLGGSGALAGRLVARVRRRVA
jgi:hypothetical protein